MLRLARALPKAARPLARLQAAQPHTLVLQRLAHFESVERQISVINDIHVSVEPMWEEYPKERPGLNYDLNWSLNEIDITPSGDAFRNATDRQLIQHSTGKIDANKALHVSPSGSATAVTYVVEGSAAPAGAVAIPARQFKRLLKLAQKYFSNAERMFVTDGAVGSSAKSEVRLRTIVDSAPSGLFLKHLTIRTPLGNPFRFGAKLTVLSASNLSIPNAENYGLKNGSGFVLSNPEEGKILAVGVSNAQLREAIAAAAGAQAAKAGALPLVADSIVTKKGQLALVFGPGLSALPLPLLSRVYGAHNNLWTAEGVARCWAGASVSGPVPLKKGYLVEGSSVTGPVDGAHPNLMPHPTAVVFLVDEAGLPQISKLSAAQAKALFAKGRYTTCGSAEAAEAFAKQLAAHDVPAYAVNASGADSKALEKAIQEAAAAGSAPPAPETLKA
eukprot:tig00001249_g7774.t1